MSNHGYAEQARVLDKDNFAANIKQLNNLAKAEYCSVNAIVTKLITRYRPSKS